MKGMVLKQLEKVNVRIILGITLLYMTLAYWNAEHVHKMKFVKVVADSVQDEELDLTPKDFALPDAKGRQVHLSDFKGKPILLNFWASWCPPCIEELPSLVQFAEWAKKELGLVVLAVSVDEAWPAVDEMFKTKLNWSGKEVPFTILLNKTSDVAASYGTMKYPESYFITKDFKIVRKFVGAKLWTSQEMMRWVQDHSR